MTNGNALINLGELSKPATVLIERVSDAVGGIFKPYQIKRLAQAEAEADKIKALAQIEIGDIQQRALARFLTEETKKQENIESITRKALPDVKEDANPQDVEEDWIAYFFDKSRLVSDEEMQSLWAKVLAGEANAPGQYSKRTVNMLSSLDKSDAMLFTRLCSFGWFLNDIVPLIYNLQNDIYKNYGITFNDLKHLDDIGLISFSGVGSYAKQGLPEVVPIHYYGTPIHIQFPNKENNELVIGKVLLSKTGDELALISGSKPVDGFVDYVLGVWMNKKLVTFSPWPQPTGPSYPGA